MFVINLNCDQFLYIVIYSYWILPGELERLYCQIYFCSNTRVGVLSVIWYHIYPWY